MPRQFMTTRMKRSRPVGTARDGTGRRVAGMTDPARCMDIHQVREVDEFHAHLLLDAASWTLHRRRRYFTIFKTFEKHKRELQPALASGPTSHRKASRFGHRAGLPRE